MKKIIIASLVLVTLNYLMGWFYTKSPYMTEWGDGTFLFFWAACSTGITAIIGFINEKYKNLSHWIIVGFCVFTWAYILLQIIIPALKR